MSQSLEVFGREVIIGGEMRDDGSINIEELDTGRRCRKAVRRKRNMNFAAIKGGQRTLSDKVADLKEGILFDGAPQKQAQQAAQNFGASRLRIDGQLAKFEDDLQHERWQDARVVSEGLARELEPVLRSSIAKSPEVVERITRLTGLTARLQKHADATSIIAGALKLSRDECQVRLLSTNLSSLQRFDVCQAEAVKACVKKYGKSVCDAAVKQEE